MLYSAMSCCTKLHQPLDSPYPDYRTLPCLTVLSQAYYTLTASASEMQQLQNGVSSSGRAGKATYRCVQGLLLCS